MPAHHDNPGEESSDTEGSVADDLAQLWTALGAMVGDVSAALNTVAPPCDGLANCPVCRTHKLISQCSPEVAQHLTAAAGSVLLALQAALKPPRTEPKQGFERITLVDETDAPGHTD